MFNWFKRTKAEWLLVKVIETPIKHSAWPNANSKHSAWR